MKSRELRIMGPVEFEASGQIMPIRGVKPRQLLTALALSPNASVPVERLVDGLWPHHAPRSVHENLRTYATTIRQSFKSGDAERPRLLASREGYRLVINEHSIDASAFSALVRSARVASDGHDLTGAAAHLTQALALWRGGRSGEGLPRDNWLGNALDALDEQRLLLHEQRAEIWLALGRHVELVPELVRLLAESPLRERLWQHLMLAHYRCGNTGAALAAYGQLRVVLAEELGIDPGQPVGELYSAMLRRDVGLAWTGEEAVRDAAVVTVPQQIPATATKLFGRDSELSAIGAALANAMRASTAVTISGPPGIGKSALAQRAAQMAADSFPGGQLYVDLRSLGQPRDERGLLTMVGSLLGALGAPRQPAELADAIGLLRASLASRRVLVVIDNAVSESQVSSLLPVCPGSAIVITSPQLFAIHGVSHHFAIGALDRRSSLELMAEVAGSHRLDADPTSAERVAALCGDSPAALHMAALRMKCRPAWTVAQLSQRLTSAASMFDELRGGGRSLRSTYSTALAELAIVDTEAALALSRLARVPAGSSQPVSGFQPGLETLADFHLLEAPSPGLFRIPKLVREFAVQSFDDTDDSLHRDKTKVS